MAKLIGNDSGDFRMESEIVLFDILLVLARAKQIDTSQKQLAKPVELRNGRHLPNSASIAC
jgi:hypothetical protein